jgi:hypothetical protein
MSQIVSYRKEWLLHSQLYMMTTNNNNQSDQLESVKAALTLLNGHLERGYKDIDVLDSKGRANIAAASLILGLLSTFQIVGGQQPVPWLYWALLALALVLYAIMIAVSLQAIRPQEYLWPMKADRENVAYYWKLTEMEYIKQITSDTIEAILSNQELIARKAKNLAVSGWLFGAVVALLVVMALVRPFV